MFGIKKFLRGLKIVPKTTLESDEKGELEVDNTSGKLNFHNGTTRSPVVTEDHAATVTNKSIDADNNTISNLEVDNLKSGVLNTSTTLAGATDTQIPSALAVKTLVEDGLAAQNEASEITLVPVGTVEATNLQDAVAELDGDIQGHINDTTDAHDASAVSYDGTTSGLVATQVQAAIDEVEARVEAVETSSGNTATDLSNHINDVEDTHDASAISNTPFGSITSTNVQSAIVELDSDIQGHIISSQGVHGIGAGNSVVGTGTTQTLTNKTITGADIRTPVRSDVKQDTKANLETYALTATNGQIVFATDTKEMFQIVDTVLVPVGGGEGGVGGVDILFVQTFETAALSDFTQTGLVLDETNPLAGDVSAQLIHQAAINQSFKQIIAVDEKFRNRNITLKLNIKSAASAGNVTLTVVDETNTVTLVSSEQLPVSNDVGGATGIVTFNVPSSCTSLSYEIVALPEAGSPVTIIDDIIAELSVVSLLETSVEVPIVGELVQAGAILVTNGTKSPAAIIDKVDFQQIGSSVRFKYQYRHNATVGAAGSGDYLFTLPNGYEFDNSVILYNGALSGGAPMGYMYGNGNVTADNVSHTQQAGIVPLSSTQFRIFVSNNVASLFFLGSGFFPFSTANLGWEVEFTVPIKGLSATKATSIPLAQSVLVQEADSTVRVDTANGYGSTGTRIRRFANLREQLGSDIQYVQSAVDGDSFVVLTDGIYTISYSDNFAPSADAAVGITRNSTSLSTSVTALNAPEVLAIEWLSSSTGANHWNPSWQGVLRAGDIIRAHTNGIASSLATRASFTISKQGSLRQINPNPNSKITIPTSELRMEGASTRGATATAIVRFDNIAKIRGDAFEVLSDATLGTRVVMKKKGKLDVSVSLQSAQANTKIQITLNQSTLTAVSTLNSEVLSDTGFSTGNATPAGGMGWSGILNVGDIIRVASSSTLAASAGNSLNLSFQEQDIAVSVTNTLPQFSESDSSVRVDTANGYGSTGTRIRRFSNVRDNIGNDIEYVPSAVNGDSFVVKSAGVYSVSYTDQSGAETSVGLSLNSNELSTNIDSINTANRLISSRIVGGSSGGESVSWSGYLNIGDTIRPHTNGAAASLNSTVNFTICKVGKPNVTGVDVTPFVNIPRDEIGSARFEGSNSRGSTATAIVVFNSLVLNDTKGLFRVDSDATLGTRITVLKSSRLNISASVLLGSGAILLTKNQSNLTLSITSPPSEILTSQGTTAGVNRNGLSYTGVFQAGDVLRIASEVVPSAGNTNSLSVLATAASDNIISPTESFSTDTANLVYAPSSLYTLATLNTAPVGTFITFTYAANTNTRTQTTTAPTQSTSDMNVNGIQLFTRAFNAASNAASPAAFAIQIGKGLKGKSLDLYKSAGKVIAGSLDASVFGATGEIGCFLKDYNEVTGILVLDSGYRISSSTTLHSFAFTDTTTQNNGYLVINASKSPVLTSVPMLQVRTAVLSDVKASGTAGGTATSGSYQTRTLNTLDDPSGIVTSLASNQFTLAAGRYYIEAQAPATVTNQHKAKIRNITDSSDAIVGTAALSGGGSLITANPSFVNGFITISSPKVFELQHRVTTTRNTDGFGSASSFGESEIYSTVKIIKIR